MEVICLANPKFVCHVSESVFLPCNWLVQGFCGADCSKCDVKEVV